MAGDATLELQALVSGAIRRHSPLNIQGGGTKQFLRPPGSGETLDVTPHRGIINYEPSELVITARAGTPLRELENALAGESQMLAFEPPHFGEGATLGGTLACGLSGPRRAHCGGARDFILGMRIINGHGEVMRFGGEVLKNVAGYDVSRLMVGAYGSLGLILDASLKVLPRPETEITVVLTYSQSAGLAFVSSLARRSLPVSATLVERDKVCFRLSGSADAVTAAHKQLGGESHETTAFWNAVKEHQHNFFRIERPLWRLTLPAHAPLVDLDGEYLIEWAGALRWLKSDIDPVRIKKYVREYGGHARRFDGADTALLEHADLPEPLMRLHARTRAAFDPLRIFNPGCLHPLL